jgi:hypothetical protein
MHRSHVISVAGLGAAFAWLALERSALERSNSFDRHERRYECRSALSERAHAGRCFAARGSRRGLSLRRTARWSGYTLEELVA